MVNPSLQTTYLFNLFLTYNLQKKIKKEVGSRCPRRVTLPDAF